MLYHRLSQQIVILVVTPGRSDSSINQALRELELVFGHCHLETLPPQVVAIKVAICIQHVLDASIHDVRIAVASGVHGSLPHTTKPGIIRPRSDEELAEEARVVVLPDPEQHAVAAAARVIAHVCALGEGGREASGEEAVEDGVGETEGQEVTWVGDVVGYEELELCR